MAAGDVKTAYAASVDLAVTALHSLAASQAWLAGWESAVIDNTSNLYLDYIVTGHLVTHASNRQAGTIYVYVFPLLNDTTYFDTLDGTESAETLTTAGIRDAAGKLGAVMTVGSTASEVAEFSFSVAALFGGVCPAKFSIFITGNVATTTAAQLAAAGSTVHVKGVYQTVAAS